MSPWLTGSVGEWHLLSVSFSGGNVSARLDKETVLSSTSLLGGEPISILPDGFLLTGASSETGQESLAMEVHAPVSG